MEQAVRILKKVETLFHHEFDLRTGLVGGAALESTGEPLSQETLDICEASDAIFWFGGRTRMGSSSFRKRPETGALLPLRKHFDLFANLRPAGVSKALSAFSPLKENIIGEGFSYIVVRELTGDVYFGKKGRSRNVCF